MGSEREGCSLQELVACHKCSQRHVGGCDKNKALCWGVLWALLLQRRELVLCH